MPRRLPGLVAVAVLLSMAAARAARPTPPDPDWKCRIVLRDAAGDTIKSDGAGAYVHGAAGVTCKIVRTEGAAHYNWLYFQIGGNSARFMLFPGQTYGAASYTTIVNRAPGTFEVKGLANVPWTGVAYTDVMPFRTTVSSPQLSKGVGQFDGDSNVAGGYYPSDGTSSVFVEPLDQCAWRVTSYTTEDTSALSLASGERPGTQTSPTRVMRLIEGGTPTSGKATVRGDFPMPFAATITIVGNNPGCP